MTPAARFRALVAGGDVVNHYQPIVDLRSGRVLGVEALGRLRDGADVIPPGAFLPALDNEGLEALLFTSLPQGLATLRAGSATHPALFMSFNVSPLVMLRDGFVNRLLQAIERCDVAKSRVTLEILESDEFLDVPAARQHLDTLHAAGVSLALDDVGAGYASLGRIRDLAVDKIKLDQAFVRELQQRPENLHFVAAMLSLARGLHKELVIEGVETQEIMEALGVLGVQAAQGYAIARPMPAAALLAWLAGPPPPPVDRTPRSLLGSYATHLNIVEACRALANQPLKVSWSPDMRNPHVCAIGRLFDQRGLHDTPYGLAHKRFHQVIDRYDADPTAWEAAASELWQTLQEAIKSGADRAGSAVGGKPKRAAPAAFRELI